MIQLFLMYCLKTDFTRALKPSLCTVPLSTAALQDIASSEAELTKRRVQVSAGGKQADKMTRDAAKTQTDLDKASADMQAKQRDFKVRAVVSCRSPCLACVTHRGNLKVCLPTFAKGRLLSHRPAQQKGFRRAHWLLHEKPSPLPCRPAKSTLSGVYAGSACAIRKNVAPMWSRFSWCRAINYILLVSD